MARLMSDAEIRRRKKTQGHISQVTGGLGLAALGGTLAASRGGRTALRKVPALKSKIKAPPPKDPNRDRIKGAITPVLATSAGLGGLGAFNFAAYTNAESRKRKQTVVKSMGVDMGYYGDEGHQGVIEKAWDPVASNYSSERSRQKRAKVYEGAALAGAGAGGAAAAHYGVKTGQAAGKLKPKKMAPMETGKAGAKVPFASKAEKAVSLKGLKTVGGHGAKAAAGVGTVGLATAAHRGIKRKRETTWQPYAKRDTLSAFGVDHQLDQ
jgi:hypothetical protein